MEKNDLNLRPRFSKELKLSSEMVLKSFEKAKLSQDSYVAFTVNNHVYLKIPKKNQHYWSPQLHLEIDDVDTNNSLLRGLFGPNPAIWTMFMFFHFLVGGLFIAFGIWAYANYSLGSSFLMQLILFFTMLLLWFVLYYVGRMGKETGNGQMHELYNFMNSILNTN